MMRTPLANHLPQRPPRERGVCCILFLLRTVGAVSVGCYHINNQRVTSHKPSIRSHLLLFLLCRDHLRTRLHDNTATRLQCLACHQRGRNHSGGSWWPAALPRLSLCTCFAAATHPDDRTVSPGSRHAHGTSGNAVTHTALTTRHAVVAIILRLHTQEPDSGLPDGEGKGGVWQYMRQHQEAAHTYRPLLLAVEALHLDLEQVTPRGTPNSEVTGCHHHALRVGITGTEDMHTQ